MNQAIREIVAAHGRLNKPIDEIGDDDDLFALGLSSMQSVQLMLGIEDHFDVEFPMDRINRSTFSSVTSIAEALEGMAASA